jgi:hypothetical protein
MEVSIKPIEELLGVELQPGVKRGPIAINLVLEEASTGARVGADVAFDADVTFKGPGSPAARPRPRITSLALRQQEVQGMVGAGLRWADARTIALVLRPGQLGAGAAAGGPSSKPGGAQAAGAPSQLLQGPAAGGGGEGWQLTAGGRRAGTPTQRAAIAAAAAGGEQRQHGQGRSCPRAPKVIPAGWGCHRIVAPNSQGAC